MTGRGNLHATFIAVSILLPGIPILFQTQYPFPNITSLNMEKSLLKLLYIFGFVCFLSIFHLFSRQIEMLIACPVAFT